MFFADDRGMKTKNLNKTWIRMVSIYFKFISEKYNKLYLPVSRRGNRGGRCRGLCRNLLVILLVCE